MSNAERTRDMSDEQVLEDLKAQRATRGAPTPSPTSWEPYESAGMSNKTYDPYSPNKDDGPVDNSPRAWLVGIVWFIFALLALVGFTVLAVRLIGG
jgi:hypothetical protein